MKMKFEKIDYLSVMLLIISIVSLFGFVLINIDQIVQSINETSLEKWLLIGIFGSLALVLFIQYYKLFRR